MRSTLLLALLALAPLAASQAPALPILPIEIPSLAQPPAAPMPSGVPDEAVPSAPASSGPPTAAPSVSLDAPTPLALPDLPLAVTKLWLLTQGGAADDPFLERAGAPAGPPPQARSSGGLPLVPIGVPTAGTEAPPAAPRVRVPVGPVPPSDASPLATTIAVGATALLALAARLYSRFEKDDVLDAEPRAQLRDVIAASPGATLPEIMAQMGMSRGRIVHHAQMLERHGVIASRHDGLHRRFFLAGPRVDPVERPPTPAARRVLDVLATEGPLTQVELARRLGVTVQAANQHLVRLRSEARVEVREADGERRWITRP